MSQRKVIIHNHLPAFVTRDRTAHLRTVDGDRIEELKRLKESAEKMMRNPDLAAGGRKMMMEKISAYEREMRKLQGTNDANQAYKVKVRRLATGADYNIRIFAASQEAAEARAKVRAAAMERIPEQKLREMESRGNGVFRIVSSMLDPDQSRPSFDAKEEEGKWSEAYGPDGKKHRVWVPSGKTAREASKDVSYQETEGKKAAEEGRDMGSCPYPKGSEPARRWRDGYNSVQQVSKAADRRARRK